MTWNALLWLGVRMQHVFPPTRPRDMQRAMQCALHAMHSACIFRFLRTLEVSFRRITGWQWAGEGRRWWVTCGRWWGTRSH